MTTITQRTSGMTAIGILNIVFGGLGGLFSLLAIAAGGLFATIGATQSHTTGAHGAGTFAVAGGGFVMFVGLLGLAFWATLVASGVGVLKLAPWGRKFTIVCGVLGVVVFSLAFILSSFHFDVTTVGPLTYSALLIALCMQPEWKAAFDQANDVTGTTTSTTTGYTPTQTQTGSEQFRRAA